MATDRYKVTIITACRGYVSSDPIPLTTEWVSLLCMCGWVGGWRREIIYFQNQIQPYHPAYLGRFWEYFVYGISSACVETSALQKCGLQVTHSMPVASLVPRPLSEKSRRGLATRPYIALSRADCRVRANQIAVLGTSR